MHTRIFFSDKREDVVTKLGIKATPFFSSLISRSWTENLCGPKYDMHMVKQNICDI
jgi:hypothetical protein